MKNKKWIWILIALILLVLVVVLFFVFGRKSEKSSVKTNSNSNSTTQSQSKTTIIKENFVKCDIDGQKDVMFEIINVNYTKKPFITLLMARREVINSGTPIF